MRKEYTMKEYLFQIIQMIIIAVVAWLGAEAKRLYKKYVSTEIKQSVCRTVVRFVEQVYVDLHGSDKLHMAMQRAVLILEEYGITISENELIALLEAAVNEFNNTFHKNDDPPDEEFDFTD